MKQFLSKQRRLRQNVSRKLLICLKCGLSNIEREEYDIICNDCGYISFMERKVE